MRSMIVALLAVGLLTGCSEILRPSGSSYLGYTCRKSIIHFDSKCSSKDWHDEEAFEAKVQFCEKELATNVCDKEQATLLWCMGRVVPGQNWNSYDLKMEDGCDCSRYKKELKECRRKKGIIDDY